MEGDEWQEERINGWLFGSIRPRGFISIKGLAIALRLMDAGYPAMSGARLTHGHKLICNPSPSRASTKER